MLPYKIDEFCEAILNFYDKYIESEELNYKLYFDKGNIICFILLA